MIPVIMMTEAELGAWLVVPFNPPGPYENESAEEAFADEYWGTHEEIVEGLRILGASDFYGDGDFCPNQDFEHSRVVGITLTSEKMMSPHLIPLCQHLLKKGPTEYEVMITHDLLDISEFWMFVTTDSVKVYFKETSDIRRFGLSPCTAPNKSRHGTA
jgi:hypothetical protein